MPIFSVIIPIYNAEKTLKRCLDSLCNQTYTDFEVLLIENGSVDSSRNICFEYTEKDMRFKLYPCKENKGPSVARNIGLNSATGSYIAFIDSDDYVDTDYLYTLNEAFKNSDVVFFGCHRRDMHDNFISDNIPDVCDNLNYYEKLIELYNQDAFGYTWIKAFRKDTIAGFRFSEFLNLLEDEVFACEVLKNPCEIKIVPKAIYNYIIGNQSSLIGRTHQDYCIKVDVAYKSWKSLLANYEKRDDVLQKMADAHVSRCMYYFFERKVNLKEFLDSFSECMFFKESVSANKFTEYLNKKRYSHIYLMRTVYRVKNKIAVLLKG